MRVGRPHGLDGSFHVDEPLEEGAVIEIDGREYTVVERKGTDAKPIVRVSGVADRDAAALLRGQVVGRGPAEPPGEGEWLVAELVGCRIEGLGTVTRVIEGPSCDVLEVGETLVPLVTDAVTRVDVEAKTIEVDRRFLGL